MLKKIEIYLEGNLIAVLIYLWIISLFIYFLAASIYYYFLGCQISDINSDWSAFGDYMGGILNPFFSFMAFTTLIVTFHLQWGNIQQSKTENENTLKALNTQSAIMSSQYIDNKFFQLIKIHHDIVNDLKIYDDKNLLVASGRTCFYSLYKCIDQTNFMFPKQDEELKTISVEWDKIYSKYSSYLGHYFRNLYHIVKYIDSIKLDISEDYISILRAQLSVYEIVFLFFNGLSDIGSDFKRFIEHYSLLKNLPEKELKRLQQYLFLYNSSAYTGLPEMYPDISFEKGKNDDHFLADKF